MKNEKVVLGIRNMAVYQGEMAVLQPVDMNMYLGEVLALIGPSRSGKSLFLRALQRMLEPGEIMEGIVTLYGKNLYTDFSELEARRRIGRVFSRASIFPGSIFTNAIFGLKMQGVHNSTRLEEVAMRALQRSGLWEEVKDRLNKPASRLSEGQQQRLCIARALALEPDVLLLDNVCSALDPIATGRIEEVLGVLKTDMAVVLATQSVQQASRVSDSTAFMLQGSLIEYGRTEELYIQPRNSLTADYLSGRYL